ncbi:trypsin-like serine protease [Paractinoplanes maris]|uniref:trypsin-like serine protease n=1 Tax=Paractinoplanes maris TaxID=1734446 RepID=UPI0020222B07|nr:trypsin-like serine protease [Actinoplanes maris]
MRKKSFGRAVLAATVLTGALAGSVPAYGVVDGTAVADGAYGFVAHLAIGIPGDGQACTGALVDPQWVITETACFGAAVAGRPPVATTVTIGRTDLSGTGGQVRTATRLVPHPSRDVVLVRLDKPTTLTPVALSTTAPATGEVLQLAGYGRTADTWVPGRLHAAAFSVSAVNETRVDVAGTSPGQPGLCKGDAGGPALRETGGAVELVALHHASYQGGCIASDETRRDAVESRLDDLTGWIRGIAPGGPAQDHREDVTLVYAYSTGAAGPFTFTTAATGTMTARGGFKSADGSYNTAKMKVLRGDFNGDDIVDQAVLNGAANGTLTLDTFLARADGTYSGALRSWTSTTFGSYDQMKMTSGDFNGDGRTDVAGFYSYANKSVGLFTWLARADGGFGTPARSWLTAASPVWGETARMKIFNGDFNGDGRTDLGSFYKYPDNSVGLLSWTANATGGFAAPVRGWFAPATPYWGDPDRMTIAAGDFNGDGLGDVAGFYAYATDGNLAMQTWTAKAGGGFNNPFSSWKSTTSSWGSWERTRFTAGDFNGDGRDDLAALYGYSDGSVALHTLVAAPNGGFATPVRAWTSATFGSYASIRLAEDQS